MDEIKTPNFVNDRYYQSKYEEYKNKNEENEKVIKNLKIHNRLIKLISLGAVLVLAGTNPRIQNAFDVVIDTIIEYDNNNFNMDREKGIQEIEELNDRSIKEIIEQGKSK